MAAERDVIDLDAYDDQPAEAGTAGPDRLMTRRRTTLRIVAAFVVGVVLGGVVVNEAREAREQRERKSTVSLVAFPASVDGAGSDVEGVLRLRAQLVVINAGSAPITVREVTAQTRGVLIRDPGRSVPVRPGGTAWLDLTARVECSVDTGDEPFPMRFVIETAYRQVREVTVLVPIVGTVWYGASVQRCQQLR